VKVKIGADRYTVIATVQWGYGGTFSHKRTRLPRRGQADPGREGMSGWFFFMRNPIRKSFLYGADPRQRSWFRCGSTGNDSDRRR
jgi:hypothetical protein